MSEREKFTPGPWVVYPVSVNSESCDIVKQDDTNDRISVTCEQSMNAGRELANAHLIAAAPELYAICDEIRDAFAYFSEWDLPIGFEARLDAALAKARGEA